LGIASYSCNVVYAKYAFASTVLSLLTHPVVMVAMF
jgi:hypothetical protein